MADFDQMSALQALEASLAAATHLTARHTAAVAAARHLAERVDELWVAGWVLDGKLDNVTLPTYLKYLEKLGLVAEGMAASPSESQSSARQALDAMRNGLSVVS